MIIFRKIFQMVDFDNDGTVDFNELLVIIVLMSHLNDLGSRLSFAFDMLVINFSNILLYLCRFIQMGCIRRWRD
jgi:hypothetical protein